MIYLLITGTDFVLIKDKNKVKKINSYPLPRNDPTLDALAGSK